MNEKERIIELVRQNIITMDEALRLLEAGNTSSSDVKTKTEEEVVHEKVTDTKSEDHTEPTEKQEKVDYGKQFSSIVSEVVDQSLNVARSVTDYVAKMAKDSSVKSEDEAAGTTDYSEEYRQAQADVEAEVRENASESVKASDKLYSLKQQLVELHAKYEQLEAERNVPGLDETRYETLEEEIEAIELEIEAVEIELDLLADGVNDDEEAKAAKLAEKSSALSAKIDQLTEEMKKKTDALTIAKQRLREIEIFIELDEITEEMSEQQQRLALKVTELETSIQEMTDELAATKAEQDELYASHFNVYKEQVKNFVDSASEKVSEAASQIGSDAIREGKSFGKMVGEQVKDLLHNFNMKEVNLSVNVPWVKTQTINHTFVYPAEDLTLLDFRVNNGSIEFATYDGSEIIIESEIRFHGNHSSINIDRFMELSTISHTPDQLIFRVNHAKISLDAVVKLPKHLYNELKVVAMNGDLTFKGIEAKDVLLENKNGDVKFKKTQANFLELDLLNGDVIIKDSDIDDISLKNLNGDFRVIGNLGNLISNTVNTDYFITKRNITPSKIKIKGVNGDVKISLPAAVNIEADCHVSFGDIHQRLSNLSDVTASKSHTEVQRYLNAEAALVDIDVSLTTGDVFLKDTTK